MAAAVCAVAAIVRIFFKENGYPTKKAYREDNNESIQLYDKR